MDNYSGSAEVSRNYFEGEDNKKTRWETNENYRVFCQWNWTKIITQLWSHVSKAQCLTFTSPRCWNHDLWHQWHSVMLSYASEHRMPVRSDAPDADGRPLIVFDRGVDHLNHVTSSKTCTRCKSWFHRLTITMGTNRFLMTSAKNKVSGRHALTWYEIVAWCW